MKKIILALVVMLSMTVIAYTQTGPKKADGTPDMRYKENKATAKPTGPKKADGTPDMRFKANKDAKPATVKKIEPAKKKAA
jgi:hypothetical protein